jgi:hypothetical protein
MVRKMVIGTGDPCLVTLLSVALTNNVTVLTVLPAVKVTGLPEVAFREPRALLVRLHA